MITGVDWHEKSSQITNKVMMMWQRPGVDHRLLSRVEHWVSVLVAAWHTDRSTDSHSWNRHVVLRTAHLNLTVAIDCVWDGDVSSDVVDISVSDDDWAWSEELAATWVQETWESTRVSEAWWLGVDETWSATRWGEAAGVRVGRDADHFDWGRIGGDSSDRDWERGRGLKERYLIETSWQSRYRKGRGIICWNDVVVSSDKSVAVSVSTWGLLDGLLSTVASGAGGSLLDWLHLLHSSSAVSRSTRAQSWGGLAVAGGAGRLLGLEDWEYYKQRERVSGTCCWSDWKTIRSLSGPAFGSRLICWEGCVWARATTSKEANRKKWRVMFLEIEGIEMEKKTAEEKRSGRNVPVVPNRRHFYSGAHGVMPRRVTCMPAFPLLVCFLLPSAPFPRGFTRAVPA